MGFFSKKTYVCEKCGKEFQTRKTIKDEVVCDRCWFEEYEAKETIKERIGGYEQYYEDVFYKQYSLEELKQIEEHRDKLLEKFKNTNGITRDELYAASMNYKKLTDGQATEIVRRILDTQIPLHVGAAGGISFFCPTNYRGMIVDADDVFAVAYTTNSAVHIESSEVITCAVFTNDPYVPVFTMTYVEERGLFEIGKSKKGREAVELLFKATCRNLQYPVCDIKQLKNQIKQEGIVRGKVDSNFMLEQMDKAYYGMDIFSKKYLTDILNGTSKAMLEEIGYMTTDDIEMILEMDKMFQRNFWNKHINNVLYGSR